MKKRPLEKGGRPYDKNGFMWAVMYKHRESAKPRILALYERHSDARTRVVEANQYFKGQGFGDWHYSIRRFMMYYRGVEIDAYDHLWERTEKHGQAHEGTKK